MGRPPGRNKYLVIDFTRRWTSVPEAIFLSSITRALLKQLGKEDCGVHLLSIA
jgi:hypothetical protein